MQFLPLARARSKDNKLSTCSIKGEVDALTSHLNSDEKQSFVKGYFEYPVNYRHLVQKGKCTRCTALCFVGRIINQMDE